MVNSLAVKNSKRRLCLLFRIKVIVAEVNLVSVSANEVLIILLNLLRFKIN